MPVKPSRKRVGFLALSFALSVAVTTSVGSPLAFADTPSVPATSTSGEPAGIQLLNQATALAIAVRGSAPTSATSLPTGPLPDGVDYAIAELISDAAGSYAVFVVQPTDVTVPASLGLLQPTPDGSSVLGTLWMAGLNGALIGEPISFTFAGGISEACSKIIQANSDLYSTVAAECQKLPNPKAQAGCLLGTGVGLGVVAGAGCALDSPAAPSGRFMSFTNGASFYQFVHSGSPGSMFANNIVRLDAGPYCVHYPVLLDNPESYAQCYSMNFSTRQFVPTTVKWTVETKWPDGLYSWLTYTSQSTTNHGTAVGIARYNIPLPYGTYTVNIALVQLDLCPQGQYFPSACTGPSNVDKAAAQIVFKAP